ncbi:DUF4407 domain-containing protein [Thermopolyspora sp. NPDC052614]|uniref:DUF4407 domain-containing protein n=1 Tax=Thermopolyspora sp. NPDC052614 TaxID=3155682 RepID=UPI00341E42A3
MKERGQPRVGPITRILLWCGATDPHDLASRTETYRYSMLGVFVLLVALLAGVSCTIYITIINDGFHPLIVVAAAFWAVLIFSLDRSIVSEPSYGADTLPAKAGRLTFFGARIAVAILVAWLIGDALVLTIFRPEITQEIAHVQEAEANAARQRVITRLESRRGDVKEQLDANKKLRDDAKKDVERFRDVYVEERKGTSGTGLIGNGSVAKANKDDYTEAQNLWKTINNSTKKQDKELNKQITTLNEQITSLKSGDEKALAKYPELKAEIDAIRGNDGWLAHLRGLSAFLDKNRGNWAIVSLPWLLRGLFVAIDLMPLTMKVLNRWTLYGRRQRDRFNRLVNRDKLRGYLDHERDWLEYDTAKSRETWRHSWRIDHMQGPGGTNGAGHGR